VAAERLRELVGIAERSGRPWYHKLGLAPDNLITVDADWYRQY
jgi:hypothetical protein